MHNGQRAPSWDTSSVIFLNSCAPLCWLLLYHLFCLNTLLPGILMTHSPSSATSLFKCHLLHKPSQTTSLKVTASSRKPNSLSCLLKLYFSPTAMVTFWTIMYWYFLSPKARIYWYMALYHWSFENLFPVALPYLFVY